MTSPATFDPLRPRLHVGWLPKGWTGRLRNAAVSAEFLTGGPAGGSGRFEVYVVPRTGGFPAWGDVLGPPVDGPDVNGLPSTWWRVAAQEPVGPSVIPGSPSALATPSTSPAAAKGAAILRWEWAPGADAQVRVEGVADPRDVATRIARSVRLDRQTPFAMPLTISHPRGMRALRTADDGNSGSSDRDRRAVIEFGKKFGERPSVLVGLGTVRAGKNAPGPNATLNGRPAREDLSRGTAIWQISMGTGEELSLYCNAADDSAASQAANRAECRRVAASAVLVGTLRDPSTWSTDPVR